MSTHKRSAAYLSIALGTAFTAGVAMGPTQSAQADPFLVSDLGSGYMVAANAEGKCGEGKCGGEGKAEQATKGKEGECGGEDQGQKDRAADKEGGEGKCGEGKCANT